MANYFCEGKHYSFNDIKILLDSDSTDKTDSHKNQELNDEQIEKIIKKLKSFYVVKAIKSDKPEYSELSDPDYVVEEPNPSSTKISYVFTFVGIILLDNVLIKCFPKYIEPNFKKSVFINEDESKTLTEKFKTILQVLQKYNQKKTDLSLYNGEQENKSFNKIPLALYILQDFLQNGLYSSQKEIVQTNGAGEILWDKTINETFALLQNNTPYYFDLQTLDITQDDLDFIRRLHQIIVTECSKLLQQCELSTFFDLPEINLTHETFQDLGDIDFIKYKLEKSIQSEFVTSKKTLLKSLYTYVAEVMSAKTDDSICLFGTTSFNLVWEKALAEIFDNKYEQIKNYIEKPEWKLEEKKYDYDGELIPDILCLCEDENKKSLYILDAKYYKIKNSENKIEGNPGIQDVVKQYVYNSALNSYIENEKITQIANVFLVPKSENLKEKDYPPENDKFSSLAIVPFWSVQHAGIKELPTVQVVKVNPSFVWEKYLSNAKLQKNDFNCIKTSPTKLYLYSNEDENSGALEESSDTKKRILVGFIRKKYFKHIKENIQSNKSDFIFYCYSTNSNFRFPLHPYIDFCTEIICYNQNSNEVIKANLKPHQNQNNRCIIEETTQENLINDLSVQGYKKELKNEILTYYKFYATDAIIIPLSDATYLKEITTIDKLKSELNKDCLNNVLYKFSPKVLEE